MNSTVLYIEDNEDNVFLVERILKRRPGVELIAAHSGQDGLRRAKESAPTVILLDRRLPDMLGDEVLTRLKADRDTSTIPVVMLSGDDSAAHAAEALASGAEEYLGKPFEIGHFLAVVDRFCVPDGR